MDKIQDNINYKNLEDTIWKLFDSFRGNPELSSTDGLATILLLLTLMRLYNSNDKTWKLLRNTALHNTEFSLLQYLNSYQDRNSQLWQIIEIYKSLNCRISSNSVMGLITSFDNLSINKENINDEEFSLLFESIIYKLLSNFDKKQLGEYYLPKGIQNLICKLISPLPEIRFYLPMVGAGFIIPILQRLINNKDAFYFGDEQNTFSFFILNLIILHNHINNAKFINTNIPDIESGYYDRIICDPPFNAIINNDLRLHAEKFPIKINNFSPKTYEEIYIYFTLNYLSKDGKALFILPSSFLFSKKKSTFNLRKYLVENDLIQAVISLQSGLFSPLTNIPVNILILKRMNKRLNNKVLFIDCTDKNIALHQNEVIDTYFNILKTDYSNTATKQEIIEQNYDISPKRYIHIINIKENLISTKDGRKLSSIVNITRGVRIEETDEDKGGIPFIRVKDLSNEKNIIYLSNKDYERRRLMGKKDKIMSETVLLVARTGNILKPVIFLPEKSGLKQILISSNVIALIPKSANYNIEYLYFQFYEKTVLQQITSSGATIPYFKLTDLKNLIIPNTNDESVQVEKYKQKLFEEGQKEFLEKFKDVNGNIDRTEQETLLIRTLSHNTSPWITKIDSLLCLLESKVEDNKSNEYIEKAKKNLKLVENYILNLQKYAKVDYPKSDFSETEISEFLKEAIEIVKPKGLRANISINCKPAIINLHKDSIKEMLTLLLTNAEKHAFLNIKRSPKIKFEGKIVGAKYILEYSNNGNPFNLTTEEFITPGIRGNKKIKGDGFGGAHIYKIMLAHKGNLEIIEGIKNGILIRFTLPFESKEYTTNVYGKGTYGSGYYGGKNA